MPNYIRLRVEGGTYFFTVVTYQRIPILTSELARTCLHNAWQTVNRWYPFETLAVCLLPDHLHCIWKLPDGDADYSLRWNKLKGLFTREYLAQGGIQKNPTIFHKMRREASIWQRRFWEHTIQDPIDLENHLDYIHYNPIKHGYVTRAIDWKWSTFSLYVKKGVYDQNWVGGINGRLQMVDWE